MVLATGTRRGRCPHRPETLRAESVGTNVPPCCRTFGTMRASSPTRVRVPPWRRVWRGHLQLKNGPGSCGRLAPLIRQGCALPPSPWGKASSGGGLVHRGLSWTFRGPLHTRHAFGVPPSPSRRGLFSAYLSSQARYPQTAAGDTLLRAYSLAFFNVSYMVYNSRLSLALARARAMGDTA